MLKFKKLKLLIMLFGLLMPITLCGVNEKCFIGDGSPISIKETHVQSSPKGSSIQATIDGHYLTVVFLENLGQVNIVITDANDHEIRVESTPTPTGVNIYISNTGSYVVTFTLPNGDEYYGEFEVTD